PPTPAGGRRRSRRRAAWRSRPRSWAASRAAGAGTAARARTPRPGRRRGGRGCALSSHPLLDAAEGGLDTVERGGHPAVADGVHGRRAVPHPGKEPRDLPEGRGQVRPARALHLGEVVAVGFVLLPDDDAVGGEPLEHAEVAEADGL